MPSAAVVLLGLLVVATVVFAAEWIPADVTALTLLGCLLLFRDVNFSEAFSGFASGAVVILAAAFIFTGALSRGGISRRLGQLLVRITSGKKGALRAAIITSGALLSLVMNNVAAAAVLLPGASEAMRQRRLAPSKVLMPMAFATQLGGMATLLTTSNIVVGELLVQKRLRPFGLTEFLPVGGCLAVAGLLYLYFISPRLLPEPAMPDVRSPAAAPQPRSLTRIYELGRRLVSARILPGSPMAGTTLGKSGLSKNLGVIVIAVVHADGTQRRAPEPGQILSTGDILILDGVPPDSAIMREAGLEVIRIKRPTRYLSSTRVALMEAVLAPRSAFAGKTLRELNFREAYGGLSVLSIWRNGAFLSADLSDVKLQFGDALLLQGPRTGFARLRAGGEILLLQNAEADEAPPGSSRPALTLAIIGAALLLAIVFQQALPAIFFGGAVMLLLTKCLPSDEAYKAVDWKSVVLVAAMLPLGIALSRTGAAQMLANGTISLFHAHGALPLLAAFTVLTAILTQVLPGGASAPLIVAPIAISTAVQLGANPRAFAMAVALATGTSMLAPFSHPVNVLVMGPGGYNLRDYVRAGLPLVILLVIGIVALVPVFFPL